MCLVFLGILIDTINGRAQASSREARPSVSMDTGVPAEKVLNKERTVLECSDGGVARKSFPQEAL